MKVLTVFGTRPEAIKMAPLVKQIEKTPGFESVVCVTGQHKEMLTSVLEIFDIKPQYDLEIMKASQTLYDVTTGILNNIKKVIETEKPDILLVHGDTSTTFSAALAGFYSGVKIGHVEAGLRTYDLQSPFPEEFNRQAVGLLADINFCPTEKSKENLVKENKNQETMYVTGNTAIDAMTYTIRKDFRHELVDWIGDDRMILLTAHRRENLGKPLENIFDALNEVTAEFNDIKVIYPIHMNPKIRQIAKEKLANNDKIRIVDPMSVVDFHNIMNLSYLILSDSGGIQEEAPGLGKPVLVLRDTTERPEGIEAGTLKLVGTDRATIVKEVNRLLTNEQAYAEMSQAVNPYGDGTASKQIVNILKNHKI